MISNNPVIKGVQMIRRKRIGQHELIGLDIEVISASDQGIVGISGTMTDETKNTFTIKKKIRRR